MQKDVTKNTSATPNRSWFVFLAKIRSELRTDRGLSFSQAFRSVIKNKKSQTRFIDSKDKQTNKMTSNNISSRGDMTLSSLSRVGWLSLILSFASDATAFQSSPREPFALLHRGAVRDTSTEVYGRQNYHRKTSTTTRLQYRDGNEDPQAVKPSWISSRWWNSIFSSQSDSVNEQDGVDAHLEFLDRRYNRLHEEKEEKPFSAINWLLQGPGKEGDILPSQQEKEDALYVLGVAGLASQKLLQKHPHRADKEVSTLKEATPVPIEAIDALAASAEDVTFGHLLIKKVLVPLVKLFYFVHRRKQIFLNVQYQRARHFVGTAAKTAIRALFYGPSKAFEVILEIGGGKANVVTTLAIASTLFLLTRPLMQAVVTESSIIP
jgi:hypothetical protein